MELLATPLSMRRGLTLLCVLFFFAGGAVWAQEARILFLYGSVPPGTYPEEMVRLTETGPDGYAQLAETLGLLGFTPEERPDTGPSVNPLTQALLSQFNIVVFGSNNRRFTVEEQAEVLGYVKTGGAIFLFSDYQFGPSPDSERRVPGAGDLSDNDILQHFGMALEPDNFQEFLATSDRFLDPKHTILRGVSSFKGEGCGMIRVERDPGRILVRGDGIPLSDGSITDRTYAITAIAEVGLGRIAVTFDRNTFFNAGVKSGGTDLSEYDNYLYAINLFLWLYGLQ